MKRCFTCQRDLDFSAFGKNRSKWDGLQARCKECRKATEPSRPEYQRAYRAKNIDILSAKAAVRHKADPEPKRRTTSEWRKANPERKKANDESWRQRNTDRVNANNRAWARANPETRKAIVRRYSQAHPEKARDTQKRRRARKVGAEVEVFSTNDVIARDGLICYLCQSPVLREDVHIDHALPLSRGGSHTMINVGVTHSACNQAKATKTPEEYFDWLDKKQSVVA